MYTIRYFDREGDYIHITFITVYFKLFYFVISYCC